MIRQACKKNHKTHAAGSGIKTTLKVDRSQSAGRRAKLSCSTVARIRKAKVFSEFNSEASHSSVLPTPSMLRIRQKHAVDALLESKSFTFIIASLQVCSASQLYHARHAMAVGHTCIALGTQVMAF